jgi:hypothetical protein
MPFPKLRARTREIMTTPTQTTGPHLKPELTLPALRSLGDLADSKPVIVVDNREQAPLIFTRLASVDGYTLQWRL